MIDNHKSEQIASNEIKRYLYLTSGILLTGVGVIGIVLPVLPTTIFLLLASMCFIKSSPKANEWLRNHRIFGAYIKNYQDNSGLSIQAKFFNLLYLWVMILISAYFLTNELYIKILLLIIAIGVTIHILMIKTKRQ